MLEESSCTPRLSFNQRDQYESGSRHIVFIFEPTPSAQVEQSRQYRCLGYASRICTSYRGIMHRSYGTPLIKTRNRLCRKGTKVVSRGSRESPSLPLKFDLRGRLRDSKNRITRRNELGETRPVPTSPTLTFMPRANIFESKTLELLIKTNSYILDIKYYFSRVY